jgi:hypothetical protein
VAIAAIGVAALYLVGVNVFLSTSLFERVVDAFPEELDVHYQRAWSLWPGWVHARGLSIRATDGNVEWILKIDDVDFRVSLAGLAAKHFEASHVHGRGVEMRIRDRLDALPASSGEVADLPPIDGLPPYALRPHVVNTFPIWDDRFWNLWTVRLSDIVAEETHEVWIDHARFVGVARLTGGFFLRPMRALDVGPTDVVVERGQVLRGKRAIIEGLKGDVGVAVSTLDPRTTHGLGFLAHLGLTTDVRARRVALAPLAPRATDVHVAGSSGADSGRFVVTGAVEANVEKTTLAGDVHLTMHLRGMGDDTDAVDLSGSEIALRDVSTRNSSDDTAQWHGRLATNDAALRLREHTLDASLALDARDAKPIVALLLGERVPGIFTRGLDVPHLEATARLSLAPGHLALRDLVARGGDLTATGDFATSGADHLGAFVLQKGPVSMGLEVAGDSVHVRAGDLAGWMEGEKRRVEEVLRRPAPRRSSRR